MTDKKENSIDLGQALDKELESLDAATLSKLRQARYAALEQENPAPLASWLPAGNVAVATGAVSATVAVAVIAFWLMIVSPQARVNVIEDIELLASVDNTELYEQMDFYDWLESQQPDKSDAG